MGNQSSTKMDPPVIFADEIWLKIFQYLTPEDLFFCIPLVCKHLYQISKDNAIWVRFGSQDWNSEKNIKAMYLKWVREQVDNHLKKINPLIFLQEVLHHVKVNKIMISYKNFLCVGDGGVGKSSLLLRYVDDTFTGSYISTIGVDFKIKNLQLQEKDLKMKLQIWDTGNGRERYRAITKAYYRGVHAILICFDTTDKKSLDTVKRWYESSISNAVKEVTIVVVGTKCDLRNAEVANEVEQYCKSLNVKYFETSAKDNVNVNEVFFWTTNAILDRVDAPNPKVTPSIKFFIKYCNKYATVQPKKSVCSLQ